MRFRPWKLSSFSEYLSNFWGVIFSIIGDLFVRSSIWTVLGLVMELCYTFPKTWLVTKPSAFTLVFGDILVGCEENVQGAGSRRWEKWLRVPWEKNSPRAGQELAREMSGLWVHPLPGDFRDNFDLMDRAETTAKGISALCVLEMPYRFCRIFQVDDTSHQAWWKSSTWQYYFTPSKCSFGFEVKIRNPNDYVQAESQVVINGSRGKRIIDGATSIWWGFRA